MPKIIKVLIASENGYGFVASFGPLLSMFDAQWRRRIVRRGPISWKGRNVVLGPRTLSYGLMGFHLGLQAENRVLWEPGPHKPAFLYHLLSV